MTATSTSPRQESHRTQPRRRLLRFGLRTVFLLMTILALPLAWLGMEAREYRREQLAIAALGAKREEHPRPDEVVMRAEPKQPGAAVGYRWLGPQWLEGPMRRAGWPIFDRAVVIEVYGRRLDAELTEQLSYLEHARLITLFGSLDDDRELREALPDAQIVQVPLP